MAKEDKSYGPQSTAGLIRYFDAEETGIKLTPIAVMGISMSFGIIVIALKFLA